MPRPNFRVTKTDGESGKTSTISRVQSGDTAQQRRVSEVEWNRSQNVGSSDSFSVHEIQHRS